MRMPRRSLPRLTLPQLWLVLAVMLPGLAALLSPLSTVDLAYQLRAGGTMLDGGGIPSVDTYTYTVAGQAWLDQQWGAQLALSAVFRVAGWTGLAVLRSLLIGAAWLALMVALRRRAPAMSARSVALLALAAFLVSAPALALRPQLIAVLFLCITLALLAGRREHPRALWLLPVLIAIWANVHGSFTLGPLLVGLAWLDDLRREGRSAMRRMALPAASGLAVLATPFGAGALAYTLSLSANRELARRVTEWQPPTLADPAGLLFLGSLLLVVVLVVRRTLDQRRPAWTDLLTLALFGALGLIAVRAVAWWPAVAVVTIAPWLAALRAAPSSSGPAARRPPSRRSLLNTSVAVILALTALPLLPAWRPVDPDLGTGAPRGLLAQAPSRITGALRALAGPGDRLWAPQVWGSWFELAIPELPVAVDSRIELFPGDLWADYETVDAALTGWPEVLDRHGVTILVVAADGQALAQAIRGAAGWRESATFPGEGSIFVRDRIAAGS